MTENIVHLVLARIEGAPPASRACRCSWCRRFCSTPTARRGRATTCSCVSIEHKLGIHASPTCVLAFGGDGGAVGYLVGEANRGLECMFIMMNAARLSVGIPGHRTCRARPAAGERVGAWPRAGTAGRRAQSADSLPITRHPDVRRMLLTMRSGVEAMRALALYAALQLDLARACDRRPSARSAALLRGELLIPIVKGWCTEYGTELVSRACRCTAAWATSRRPASRRRCATCASRPSTKARRRSRRTTCWAASSRATAARPCVRCWMRSPSWN